MLELLKFYLMTEHLFRIIDQGKLSDEYLSKTPIGAAKKAFRKLYPNRDSNDEYVIYLCKMNYNTPEKLYAYVGNWDLIRYGCKSENNVMTYKTMSILNIKKTKVPNELKILWMN